MSYSAKGRDRINAINVINDLMNICDLEAKDILEEVCFSPVDGIGHENDELELEYIDLPEDGIEDLDAWEFTCSGCGAGLGDAIGYGFIESKPPYKPLFSFCPHCGHPVVDMPTYFKRGGVS